MIFTLLLFGFLLPDPILTPGVVRPLSQKVVCETTWSLDQRFVTDKMKRQIYDAYKMKKISGVCCEIDHRVPRSLGGADDLKNLWPQLWPEAKIKDRLEVRIGKDVCAGKMSLKDGQAIILGDWTQFLETKK